MKEIVWLLVAAIFCVTGIMASYQHFYGESVSYAPHSERNQLSPVGTVTADSFERLGASNIATAIDEKTSRDVKK